MLGGLLLSRARDWLLKYPQRFLSRDMAALRAFIATSAEAEDAENGRIAAQEARTRRIERRILQGAIAAALVFTATALFAGLQYFAADRAKQEAVTERHHAEDQRNQAQITQSLFLVNLSRQQDDPGTAILLALEALPDTAAGVTRPYVPEAELQLDGAWRALRERLVLKGHTAAVRSAAFSPDGKRIVTASFDTTARLWDAESGKQIGEPLSGHEAAVQSAAFSLDGKRIVTASSDTTARLWDAESGKQIGEPLMGHTDAVRSAAFSPDGKRIVTASSDKTARLLRIFPGGTEEIVAVAKAASPRCLTAKQRHQFFLPTVPPSWYIEQEKWPYDTLAWKQWLSSDTLTGKRQPLPSAP